MCHHHISRSVQRLYVSLFDRRDVHKPHRRPCDSFCDGSCIQCVVLIQLQVRLNELSGNNPNSMSTIPKLTRKPLSAYFAKTGQRWRTSFAKPSHPRPRVPSCSAMSRLTALISAGMYALRWSPKSGRSAKLGFG